MTESMAEEWEKWIEQETTNIQTMTERLEELSSRLETIANFQYREFWDEAKEIPNLIESLTPFPPNEKERLLEEYEHICRKMKKRQQQEWEGRREQSRLNRTTIEQKIQEARSIAESAPEDMKILTKAQSLLKEALAKLKNNGGNTDSESADAAIQTVFLREDRQVCWDKWREMNDFVHNNRLTIWEKNYAQIEPQAKAALVEATEGNANQALEKVKKAQQHMKGMALNKVQREEIRETLNSAWTSAIFKANEIRDEKRRKYEEWLGRMEEQLGGLTTQFEQNSQTITDLQAEVEQFKEAIQSIRAREYGDKLRDEIAKKREKIKELEVINRQLEGKIETAKSRLEDQSNGLTTPRPTRKATPPRIETPQLEVNDQTASATEVDKITIKWLGHSAFLITANNGTTIITDPYGQYDGLNYEPISESANISLISHQHGDHCGGNVTGNPQVIDKAGNAIANGIEFRGIASHHDQSSGTQRGDNIIFCFTLDGIKVCHLGDLGHLLSNEQVQEIGEVDILMIPVGGFFTINASEATQVCNQIKPKVIIPMHVSNSKCAFPIAPIDDFVQNKSDIEQTESVEKQFAKTDLPSSTKIIVLEPAK